MKTSRPSFLQLSLPLTYGVPDGPVKTSATPTQTEKAASKQPHENFSFESGTTLTQKRPQSIILPMPITVKERYLEVREIGSDAVITVIEVLSPKNKRGGKGRMAYERKRRILGSFSNLVEIDLLRANPPMTMLGQVQPTYYRIVVSRSEQRRHADLYGFNLQEPIPNFPLPLKPENEEPIVDLQTIIAGVCERAGYDDRIDYRQPVPSPALSKTDQQWASKVLAPLQNR